MSGDRVRPRALGERTAARAKRVAGRLCLDFANLVGGWVDASHLREERLEEYADVLAFAAASELLTEAEATRLLRESLRAPAEAAAALERARGLRGAIHAIAWALERRRRPRPVELESLRVEVARARAIQTLEWDEGRVVWRLPAPADALDAPLWPIALSADEYFTTADLTRLHSCQGEDCGWHFEDQTRNRSRQWCDMGDCGNVAKVRRFRSRSRPGR